MAGVVPALPGGAPNEAEDYLGIDLTTSAVPALPPTASSCAWRLALCDSPSRGESCG